MRITPDGRWAGDGCPGKALLPALSSGLCASRSACALSHLGKRTAPKKPCSPPTSTQVGPGCAFRTRLPSTPLATLPRARLTYARRTLVDTPECRTLLPAPRRHAPRDRPDVLRPHRSRHETAPQRSDGGTAVAPVLMVISCSLPRGTWRVTPACPSGGVCQAGGWKVIRKMEDFCKIFQRPTPREPVPASLGPRSVLSPGVVPHRAPTPSAWGAPLPSALAAATGDEPSSVHFVPYPPPHCGTLRADEDGLWRSHTAWRRGGRQALKTPGIAASFLSSPRERREK
jgi:hypothetical protein